MAFMLHRVADSAAVPSNAVIARGHDRQGISAWIAYLRSPYASVSWSPADIGRVLVHAERILPVYVGPYNAATLRAMNPTRDAAQALDDLHGLTEPHQGISTVCLDIEPGAWEASPADVLAYFSRFRGELRAAGFDVAPYAAPGTLLGLGQHFTIEWVWCASWRTRYGRAPKPLWPDSIEPPGLGTAWAGRRGWQQAGGVRGFGTRADLSLFPADFPFVVHKAAAPPAPAPKPAPRPSQPAPAPAPAPDARASVAVTVDGHTYRGTIPRTG